MDLESLIRRQGGIGGSDAAAVLGVPSSYRTPLAVYESKVVPITELPKEEALGPRFWGNQLELAIGEAYAARRGVRLTKPATLRRPGVPLVASCDFLLSPATAKAGEPFNEALEVKTADRAKASEWGPGGGDKIPEQYWVQVQHYYMVIPDLERIDVAVLIGGNDYREYTIKKDEGFCRDLLSAETHWWERHVVPKIPPEATSRDTETLKRLYRGTDGEEVDLADLAHWHMVRMDAMKAISDNETVIEQCNVRILSAMGDAAVGHLPGALGRYQRKLVKRSAYAVEAQEYVELRHIKHRSKGENGG